MAPRRVCNRRTRRCRKVRARIRFTLSEDARVAGGIDRVRGEALTPVRDVEIDGEAGANAIRINGRRFKPGRYKVTLSAEDADGNDSGPSEAFFTVRRARRR